MYTIVHSSYIFGIADANGFSRSMCIDFLSHLKRLEQHRGIIAVVDQLKDRFHALDDGNLSQFSLKEGNWIGPWRWFTVFAHRGRRHLRAALRILKLYGLFVHRPPKLVDYSRLKAKLAVLPAYSMALNLNHGVLKSFTTHEKQYDLRYPLSTKRCPLSGGLKQAEVLTSPFEHIASLDEIPNFMVDHYSTMSVLVGKDLPFIDHYHKLSERGIRDIAGHITLLVKDRGLKLRPVANCNRLLQLAVSPFHHALMGLLKTIPESFVYDQDGGAERVASMFQDPSRRLTSLDLNSASDNIPLRPQLLLAYDLFPSLTEEIGMFKDIARMGFRTPYESILIHYGTGHPMGVNASFGLFTVWLIFILYLAGARNAFVIVGDDLVFDSSYEEKVLAYLHLYGVPLNLTKSLFSNSIRADFVGRVIDRHGSLKVYKASQYSKRDPLGVIRQYGRRGICLGPKKLFKSDYVNVVDAILYYQESEALRIAIYNMSTPVDVLKLSHVVPEPPVVGGVSNTILMKLFLELLDRAFPEDIPNLRDFFQRRHGIPNGHLADVMRPGSSLVANWSRNPGLAYECLLKTEFVSQVVGFTVGKNISFLVEIHASMMEALSKVSDAETGYELILAYEDLVIDQSFEGVYSNSATNIGKAERLAMKNKSDPKDHEKTRPKKEMDSSSVFFLWRLIKKVTKTYNHSIK